MRNDCPEKVSLESILNSLTGLLAIGLCLTLVRPVRAQSEGTTKAQGQDSTQAQDQKQAKSQTQSPETQSQAQPAEQIDSLAEAARKTKEKKAKSDPAKVYTEEDMSKLSSRGVSVVGEENSGGAGGSDGMNSGGKTGGNAAAQSGKNEETFWRGRARQLLDQMSATDQQIEKVKDEIKKYGNGGFDPSTGLGKNVIYVDDRQSQLARLQKQRSDLDKQMDQLQEEGRKAGASPSWFR
jgi:hypothetical protein